MRQKDNFYFRPEKVGKLVLDNYRDYGYIKDFAQEIGIDNGNFNTTTGINIERMGNPSANLLAKLAVFFDLPLDYFFTDGEPQEETSKVTHCTSCNDKERIIAQQQEVITLLREKVSYLQKKRCRNSQRCISYQNSIAL